MKKIICTLLVLFTAQAHADFCTLVTKEKATLAKQAILNADTVSSLCSTCDKIDESSKVRALHFRQIGLAKETFQGKVYWKIQINNEDQDLANIYVNGLNLAQLVGPVKKLCATEKGDMRISSSLQEHEIRPEETGLNGDYSDVTLPGLEEDDFSGIKPPSGF